MPRNPIGNRFTYHAGVEAKDLCHLLGLEPLPREGWSRAATVTGAGKVLERTVLFYAQWLARHERTHVKQVARIVNTMHM